ncbi:hypothetical protein GCM10023322_32800 [Rugosimonospora acidiphila]|uniref:Uncharacterized protein n=1 Tax=Rugosimonospora acidiphila TaxID=556531 RepID=A0ABP9RV19_9ACTN
MLHTVIAVHAADGWRGQLLPRIVRFTGNLVARVPAGSERVALVDRDITGFADARRLARCAVSSTRARIESATTAQRRKDRRWTNVIDLLLIKEWSRVLGCSGEGIDLRTLAWNA